MCEMRRSVMTVRQRPQRDCCTPGKGVIQGTERLQSAQTAELRHPQDNFFKTFAFVQSKFLHHLILASHIGEVGLCKRSCLIFEKVEARGLTKSESGLDEPEGSSTTAPYNSVLHLP